MSKRSSTRPSRRRDGHDGPAMRCSNGAPPLPHADTVCKDRSTARINCRPQVPERKGRMAKTKEKLYDTADTMRPYVDRALHDDALHDNLKEAFKAARDVYAELLGNRNLTATAMRAATDEDVQDNLKKAVEEIRTAANRIQGKE